MAAPRSENPAENRGEEEGNVPEHTGIMVVIQEYYPNLCQIPTMCYKLEMLMKVREPRPCPHRSYSPGELMEKGRRDE